MQARTVQTRGACNDVGTAYTPGPRPAPCRGSAACWPCPAPCSTGDSVSLQAVGGDTMVCIPATTGTRWQDLLWHTHKPRCLSISLMSRAAGGHRGRCAHEHVSYYTRLALQGAHLIMLPFRCSSTRSSQLTGPAPACARKRHEHLRHATLWTHSRCMHMPCTQVMLRPGEAPA